MTKFGVIIVSDKIVAKLVKIQKFCQYRLNHLILHQSSYSHFQIRWIVRKLKYFGVFMNIYNSGCWWKIICDPCKELKKWTLLCCENSTKNCQNHGVFEGAVIGRHKSSTRWFWSRGLSKLSEICFTKKICLYHLCLVRN